MKARHRLFPGGCGAILAAVALIFASGCDKHADERRIEIWVSPKDHPEIRAYTNEYWSYGSDLRIFRAQIVQKLGQDHTVLEGELTWSKENADQALFTFNLSNEKPITVIILGVTQTDTLIAEKDARRIIPYPPGKHSFSERLFVKYTYD